MRQRVSSVTGSPASASRWPALDECTTFPSRATTACQPARRPSSTYRVKCCSMRFRRAGSKPSSSGSASIFRGLLTSSSSLREKAPQLLQHLRGPLLGHEVPTALDRPPAHVVGVLAPHVEQRQRRAHDPVGAPEREQRLGDAPARGVVLLVVRGVD